jgi:hypothetical protein
LAAGTALGRRRLLGLALGAALALVAADAVPATGLHMIAIVGHDACSHADAVALSLARRAGGARGASLATLVLHGPAAASIIVPRTSNNLVTVVAGRDVGADLAAARAVLAAAVAGAPAASADAADADAAMADVGVVIDDLGAAMTASSLRRVYSVAKRAFCCTVVDGAGEQWAAAAAATLAVLGAAVVGGVALELGLGLEDGGGGEEGGEGDVPDGAPPPGGSPADAKERPRVPVGAIASMPARSSLKAGVGRGPVVGGGGPLLRSALLPSPSGVPGDAPSGSGAWRIPVAPPPPPPLQRAVSWAPDAESLRPSAPLLDAKAAAAVRRREGKGGQFDVV